MTDSVEHIVQDRAASRAGRNATTIQRPTRLSYGTVDGPFGVVVRGLDWDAADEAIVDELTRALRRHLLLVFRGQESPTYEQSNALWRKFGPLVMDTADGQFHYSKFSHDPKQQVHRRADGNILTVTERGAQELGWHNDQSHKPQFKKMSVLEALKFRDGAVPTAFRDMYTAFELLPKEIKGKLAGKQAIFLDPRLPDTEALPRLCDAMHPLISTHPDSGRNALFGSDWTIHRIAGMSTDESAEMIAYLRDFCDQNAPYYEHFWQEGDICVWDNFGVQHRREWQRPGVERVMRLFEGVAEG